MMNTRISKHPARYGHKLASLLALLFSLMALGACESMGPGGVSGRSGEARAMRLAERGDAAEAASAYIGLAATATGSERDRLTMLAVEQWLYAGDLDRANTAYAGVARPAAGPLLWLWQSNAAGFALARGDGEQALEILEPLSRQSLTTDHRLRVEALRADAWFLTDDPTRAVELMLQRENWLSRSREIDRNRRRLWLGLVNSSPPVLRAAAELALDPEVRGWLSLGALAASTGEQGIGWQNGVIRWRETHPGHPAMAMIEDLDFPDDVAPYPSQIALLLPLTGRAANAGLAIQNGFLGAYFETAGALDADRAQTIRVYDVDVEGGASAAYQTAVDEGAQFVVGPLLPRNVSELANNILVPVPVLTLNYLSATSLAPPGLYQYALAPEDEAVAAAERAYDDGHTLALALVPNNSWGKRLFATFATRFEELGGTVLDNRSYVAGTPDFSNTIEDLMALSGSVARYQRLRANIGGALQFDPRRRQDADFIFLAADAPNGRLLKSQLKFHYAGDLPVYSTSSIFAMDSRSNSDLNGVMFADIPWIIGPQPWIAHLPDTYKEYWPEQRRLGRLQAMGYDAYYLVGSLYAARGRYMDEVDGATGRLYLDPDGRVHRRLSWAQFQGGEPVSLPDPEPSGGPIRDISRQGEFLPPNAADADSWSEPLDDETRDGF